MIIDLTDSSFYPFIESVPVPVLVMFWATWCGPSKKVNPILDEIHADYNNLIIARVDIDKNPEAPGLSGVRGIPALMIFSGSEIKSTKVGSFPKNVLKEWIAGTIDVFEKDELVNEIDLIGLTLMDDQIRFVSLRNGKYTFIDDYDQKNNIYFPCSFESQLYKIAIEELEYILNKKKPKESELQDFFTRYPNFILNDEHKTAHSQIILENESENKKLIPDFILEPVNKNGLADILDIKLPNAKVFSLTRNREGFSSGIVKACAQLREYAHFFTEKKNRDKIYETYKLRLFEPKMIVVIGRRGTLDPILQRRIEKDLPNIVVKTYDDLIEKIKFRYQ